jgi:NADPH:quinone reductase
MRAVATNKSGSQTFVLCETAEPTPSSFEAKVKVEAFSLNLGEVRHAITQPVEGWKPGWDFAGIVEQQAADGSGPKTGARVVGFVEEGAWAEKIAVASRSIAEVPSSVTIQQAATLPVAG